MREVWSAVGCRVFFYQIVQATNSPAHGRQSFYDRARGRVANKHTNLVSGFGVKLGAPPPVSKVLKPPRFLPCVRVFGDAPLHQTHELVYTPRHLFEGEMMMKKKKQASYCFKKGEEK